MPKQGIASAFTFGRGVGAIQMAFAALNIPYVKISPQKWMKALGIKSKKIDPKDAIEFAQRIYPSVEFNRHQADALCLLEYLRRSEHGASIQDPTGGEAEGDGIVSVGDQLD